MTAERGTEQVGSGAGLAMSVNVALVSSPRTPAAAHFQTLDGSWKAKAVEIGYRQKCLSLLHEEVKVRAATWNLPRKETQWKLDEAVGPQIG